MCVSGWGDASAAGRSVNKAELKKERLVNVLDSDAFFADECGKRFETDRTAVKAFDDGGKETSVNGIEAEMVDLHAVERFACEFFVNNTVAEDLRKVTDAAEKSVCDSGRTS